MAYQPKYAKNSKRQNTASVIREPRKAAARKKEKRDKRTLIIFVLLGIVLIPASCFASFRLIVHMAENLARPKVSVQAKAPDMAIGAQFDSLVASEMENARNGLLHINKPTVPKETEPPETEPVRHDYSIPADAQVAPEPDQTLFGQTDNPAVLELLMKKARTILDGQTTYFQPDMPRYEDSVVNYYLDETIFAVTWKEVHDGSVYTFSEIKVSHPSQFRRHLAGGEYGSDMQYLTTEMAASVNAVVASAGDFYRFRDFGAVVYQGQAKRVEGTYAETCYIDANGDLHFTYGGDVLTVDAVQTFVDAHDIQFSLAFGPILVDNYELVDHTWYGVGEINEGYARAALLQMDTLHYIVVAANTTGIYQEIPTVKMFAKNIAATGCKHAYCLDGGQTATIVMNDQLINRPVYGQQRKISDIIYFATAVPEGG